MARDRLKVSFSMDRIHCHDEGDGLGSAEPYLWTVFFKIDGSCVSATDAGTLIGNAVTVGTPGSHGNLGDTDVDAGDDVPIPSALAFFDTELVPIRGGVLDTLGEDRPGVTGVVCVLMEEDNVTDAGAEAGHAALNTAVQSALDQIIATRDFIHSDVTDEEIKAFTDAIGDAVHDAVKAQQGFFANIWSWLNSDDTIGTKVFTFNTDELAGGGFSFENRWNNEGDWSIFGHVISTPVCTANTFDAAFSGGLAMTTLAADGQVASRQVIDAAEPALLRQVKEPVAAPAKGDGRVFDLAALRQFRDGAFHDHPGLARWWELAERNLPSMMFGLFTQTELRGPAFRAMRGLPAVVKDPEGRVPEALLADIATVARGLRSSTRSRRLRIDAGRVLSALPLVRGKSFRETAAVLGALEPARHPRKLDEAGRPGARVRLEGTRIVTDAGVPLMAA